MTQLTNNDIYLILTIGLLLSGISFIILLLYYDFKQTEFADKLVSWIENELVKDYKNAGYEIYSIIQVLASIMNIVLISGEIIIHKRVVMMFIIRMLEIILDLFKNEKEEVDSNEEAYAQFKKICMKRGYNELIEKIETYLYEIPYYKRIIYSSNKKEGE